MTLPLRQQALIPTPVDIEGTGGWCSLSDASQHGSEQGSSGFTVDDVWRPIVTPPSCGASCPNFEFNHGGVIIKYNDVLMIGLGLGLLGQPWNAARIGR